MRRCEMQVGLVPGWGDTGEEGVQTAAGGTGKGAT